MVAVGSMRFNKKYFCLMLLVSLWGGGLCPSHLQAEPLALTGDWAYQHASASGSQFDENYTADFSKRLDLTEVMALDTTVRYNRRSDPEATQQKVVPSVSYFINNYLFLFNLSGTADEEINQRPEDKSNRSLAANWNSAWEKQLWVPAVAANFNQNWRDDNSSPHLQEGETTGIGGSLDWDLALAKVFYSANTHEENDFVSGGQSKGQAHLTRIETDASFWDGLGVVTLSQQYAYSNNENQARVEAGVALIPVGVSAYHGEALPDPATLSVNAALTDGDKEGVAVTVNNPIRPMNIGIRTNFRQADRLYLYTERALSATISSQFSWDLYSSNNNVDWTLEQTSVAVSYNPVMKRFEFVLLGTAKEFLKLVAVRDPAITAVSITELEVFQAVNASDPSIVVRDNQATYQTDANLSLQLRPDLQLTSSVAYLQNNSSASSDMTNTGINSGLAWNPRQDWTVRLSNNFDTRKRTAALTDELRSYGLSVGFPTIPTVHSSMGVTVSELYTGGEKMNLSTNYALQFIADLYTDLTSRLNLALNQTDDVLAEAAGEQTATSQLNLTARLVPGLVANWSGTYSKPSAQAASFASDTFLSWRLSDRLSVQGGLNGSWGEADTAVLSCGFDLALSDKMQVSLNQRREISPETSNITALDWRWTINQYISMITSGAFLYGGETDEWNVSSRLSTRLASF